MLTVPGLVTANLLKPKGSGAKSHYVSGAALVAAETRQSIHVRADNMDANVDNMDASRPLPAYISALAGLPVPLRVAVRALHLKSRHSPQAMRDILQRLCDWKALSVAELAILLDKKPSYLSQKFIAPMVSEGELRYLFPEMPQHPGQKYLTPRLSDKI